MNTTSRYLDDIKNINNIYCDNMVSPIPLILKPHFWISNDIVSTKIYNKCDYFDFENVNFPF